MNINQFKKSFYNELHKKQKLFFPIIDFMNKQDFVIKNYYNYRDVKECYFELDIDLNVNYNNKEEVLNFKDNFLSVNNLGFCLYYFINGINKQSIEKILIKLQNEISYLKTKQFENTKIYDYFNNKIQINDKCLMIYESFDYLNELIECRFYCNNLLDNKSKVFKFEYNNDESFIYMTNEDISKKIIKLTKEMEFLLTLKKLKN